MEPKISDQDRRRAALSDLERLKREGDALTGIFGRSAAHFSAADAPAGDPVEVWGRRIGRALSASAFLALCAYLYFTYVR